MNIYFIQLEHIYILSDLCDYIFVHIILYTEVVEIKRGCPRRGVTQIRGDPPLGPARICVGRMSDYEWTYCCAPRVKGHLAISHRLEHFLSLVANLIRAQPSTTKATFLVRFCLNASGLIASRKYRTWCRLFPYAWRLKEMRAHARAYARHSASQQVFHSTFEES